MDHSKLTSDPGFGEPSVTVLETVKAKPAQHIPCSTGNLPSDGPDTIHFHDAYAVGDGPLPNRFNPFEALDLIEKIAGDEQTREEGVGTLLTQVHALRAYITGMKHGS